jgi:hypothetical protein
MDLLRRHLVGNFNGLPSVSNGLHFHGYVTIFVSPRYERPTLLARRDQLSLTYRSYPSVSVRTMWTQYERALELEEELWFDIIPDDVVHIIVLDNELGFNV